MEGLEYFPDSFAGRQYLLAVLQEEVDLLFRHDRYHLQLLFPKDQIVFHIEVIL